MATRFYLPSAGTPGLASLAYGSGWNRTSQATRLPLVTDKTDTADAARILTSTATTPEFHCAAQFQSTPLAAQTISGTLKGQIRAMVNNVSYNGTVAITVRVVSSDGSTIRGQLVGAPPAAPPQGATPPELGLSNTNRSFRDSSSVSAIALTDVVCEDGDILVVEVGARDEDIGTSRSANLRFNDLVAAADLPEDDTTTTASSPWVEFSGDLAFEAEEEPPAPTVSPYARFQPVIMCN